jgi:tRNA A-37 threonylcarbamoyl transferase component Bud32
MKIEMLERFNSKRNQVYKVKIHTSTSAVLAVMKKYREEETGALAEEYDNLEMLKKSGLSVPEVIYKDKDSLFLEYIEGSTVNDLVENLDTGHWVEELSRWLYELHRISRGSYGLLKGDVNLRNFVYSNNRIYGLDFEKLSTGDSRIDLGNMCFFILTNYPSFTREKHIMIRRFLNEYEKCLGRKLEEMGRFLLLSRAEAKRRRYHSG